jgi:CrcB protein
MTLYLLIALGGALGSMARFWLAGLVAEQVGQAFPWGTLLINFVGSFVIGFFATLTGPGGRFTAGAESRVFVMTGLCGGFTTFSAFSLQTLTLARSGDWARAGGNVGGSVVACLIAVWLGHVLAACLNPSRAA